MTSIGFDARRLPSEAKSYDGIIMLAYGCVGLAISLALFALSGSQEPNSIDVALMAIVS